MIRVTVRFLARLRDVVGQPQLSLELETGNLTALRAALSAVVDDEAMARLFAENVRIAVNQSLWDGQSAIGEGAEVAFLPPVTGG